MLSIVYLASIASAAKSEAWWMGGSNCGASYDDCGCDSYCGNNMNSCWNYCYDDYCCDNYSNCCAYTCGCPTTAASAVTTAAATTTTTTTVGTFACDVITAGLVPTSGTSAGVGTAVINAVATTLASTAATSAGIDASIIGGSTVTQTSATEYTVIVPVTSNVACATLATFFTTRRLSESRQLQGASTYNTALGAFFSSVGTTTVVDAAGVTTPAAYTTTTSTTTASTTVAVGTCEIPEFANVASAATSGFAYTFDVATCPGVNSVAPLTFAAGVSTTGTSGIIVPNGCKVTFTCFAATAETFQEGGAASPATCEATAGATDGLLKSTGVTAGLSTAAQCA
jgi:hypothetical protein